MVKFRKKTERDSLLSYLICCSLVTALEVGRGDGMTHFIIPSTDAALERGDLPIKVNWLESAFRVGVLVSYLYCPQEA